MSDETNVQAETPAEGAAEPAKVEAPEAKKPEPSNTDPADDAKADEPKDEGKAEGEEGDGDDRPKKRTGVQRLKAREAYLRNENAELQRKLEAFEAGRRTENDPADQPPKEEDFKGDYFAYERAMQAFNVRQVIRDEKRKDAEQNQTRQQQEARRELEIAHHERVAEAMDPESDTYIADYAQVLGKMKGVNITADVAEAIVESDKSALIAYHLANNPEKLRELNAMSGRQLAREIGRLEGSVRMPAAKKQTSAPAPLKPLAGGASPVKSDADLAKSEDATELIKSWRSKSKKSA